MKSKFILLILVIGSFVLIFSGCTAARTPTAEATESSAQETADTSANTTAAAEESSKTTVSSTEETTTTTAIVTEVKESSTQETAKTAEASIAIDCSLASEAGIKGAPEDGVVLEQRSVEIEENETAFGFLKRVCLQEDILLSYKGSGRLLFVTGIAGLGAVNAKSGWMFSVNGEFLMVGAGSYIVQENDVIVWHYTLDSGKDLQ